MFMSNKEEPHTTILGGLVDDEFDHSLDSVSPNIFVISMILRYIREKAKWVDSEVKGMIVAWGEARCGEVR